MNEDPASSAVPALIPREGWHVIHLFYQIDRSNWSLLSDEEQLEAKNTWVQDWSSTERPPRISSTPAGTTTSC